METRPGALADLARQGEQLRVNLRKPISLEARRIALERKITLDFPHFKGFLTEYSSNISMTGMFVQTSRPEPEGTIVAFELRLADGLNLIRGEAEVVWRRLESEGPERPAGMGFRFARLDKESRRLIRWAVEKQLREGGASFDLEDHAAGKKKVPSAGHSVGEVDLVRLGAEEDVDPAKRHPYAGVAVARSGFERWRLVAAAAVLAALLAAAFFYRVHFDAFQQRASPPAPADDAAPSGPAAADPPVRSVIEPGPARLISEATDMVNGWASAWSRQQVEDYLAFYAKSFRPPRGMGRAAWNALRRDRILRPQRIEVRITELESDLSSPGSVRVSFLQSYRSDSYRDATRKTLELVLEDGQWKIAEEREQP